MATTAPPLFAGSGWSSRGGPPQYPAPRARRALFASTPSRMPQTAWRDGITPKYPAPVEPTVVRRLSASSSLPLLLKHRLPQTPLGPTGRDVRTAFESGGVHTEGARHLGSRLRRALAESQRERLQDRKRDRAKIDRLREKMKTQQIDEHRTRQISHYVHEPHLGTARAIARAGAGAFLLFRQGRQGVRHSRRRRQGRPRRACVDEIRTPQARSTPCGLNYALPFSHHCLLFPDPSLMTVHVRCFESRSCSARRAALTWLH